MNADSVVPVWEDALVSCSPRKALKCTGVSQTIPYENFGTLRSIVMMISESKMLLVPKYRCLRKCAKINPLPPSNAFW